MIVDNVACTYCEIVEFLIMAHQDIVNSILHLGLFTLTIYDYVLHHPWHNLKSV